MRNHVLEPKMLTDQKVHRTRNDANALRMSTDRPQNDCGDSRMKVQSSVARSLKRNLIILISPVALQREPNQSKYSTARLETLARQGRNKRILIVLVPRPLAPKNKRADFYEPHLSHIEHGLSRGTASGGKEPT